MQADYTLHLLCVSCLHVHVCRVAVLCSFISALFLYLFSPIALYWNIVLQKLFSSYINFHNSYTISLSHKPTSRWLDVGDTTQNTWNRHCMPAVGSSWVEIYTIHGAFPDFSRMPSGSCSFLSYNETLSTWTTLHSCRWCFIHMLPADDIVPEYPPGDGHWYQQRPRMGYQTPWSSRWVIELSASL